MRNLDAIFEELSHIEYMVKESNTTSDSNLVYEGFWDTVRKGASKIGEFGKNVRNAAVTGVNAVKGAIDYVKELGQKTWDKIVALGTEFVEWVKLAKQKVSEVLTAIKNTPAEVWKSMKDLYAWIAAGVSKIIDKIKSGWDTFVQIMNTFIFKPIANTFRDAIETIELNSYYYKTVLVDDLKSLKQMADETKAKGGEKWNALMTKISSFMATIPAKAEEVGQWFVKMGKGAGLILIGLVVLPFYVAFKGIELVYKLGEQFVSTIAEVASKTWANISAVASQVKTELGTLPGAVKAGYDSIPNVAPVKNESKRTIMSFDAFLKRS